MPPVSFFFISQWLMTRMVGQGMSSRINQSKKCTKHDAIFRNGPADAIFVFPQNVLPFVFFKRRAPL